MKDKKHKSWLNNIYSQNIDDPWGLDWRPSQKFRYLTTLKLIKNFVSFPKLAIDIGCATGIFTVQVAEAYDGAKIYGIDISEMMIHKAKTNYPSIEFHQLSISDVGSLTRLDKADLIICLESLYYLDQNERRQAISIIYESMSENGILVISSLYGKNPHMTTKMLLALLSPFFQILHKEILYIKPINNFEKLVMKLENVLGKKNSYVFSKFIFSKIPDKIYNLFNLLFRIFGTFSASHTIVVAQRKS